MYKHWFTTHGIEMWYDKMFTEMGWKERTETVVVVYKTWKQNSRFIDFRQTQSLLGAVGSNYMLTDLKKIVKSFLFCFVEK